MALTVQQQDGSVNSANSYSDISTMKAYHADRGVDLSSYADPAIAAALIRATDFLDARYLFIGRQLKALQGTRCPRYLPTWGQDHFPLDYNTLEPSYLLTTMQWTTLVRACCQLAYRELKKPGGLMPDPTFDATGQKVSKKTVKAGPVESSLEYAQAPAGQSDANVPSYPAVDLLLKNVGLLRSKYSGDLARG